VLNKPGEHKDFSQDLVKHLIALLTSIIAQKSVLTAQGVGADQPRSKAAVEEGVVAGGGVALPLATFCSGRSGMKRT
jgi:hypothetical protein